MSGQAICREAPYPAPQGVAPGDQAQEGLFVRSLENRHVAKRFGRDTEPPEFGYRVKASEWTWSAKEELDGLSVDHAECVGTPACALLLHRDNVHLRHVVVIDIAMLSEDLGIPIIAVYDPNPDGAENPCHYYLQPGTGSVEGLVYRLKITYPVETNPKIPRNQDAIESLRAEREQYERTFRVHRDARAGCLRASQTAIPSEAE
jgi:hypothetical protein